MCLLFYLGSQFTSPETDPKNIAAEEALQDIYQQGMTFGISRMIVLLEGLREPDDAGVSRKDFPEKHLEFLKSYTHMDKLRLYKGERKGLEV